MMNYNRTTHLRLLNHSNIYNLTRESRSLRYAIGHANKIIFAYIIDSFFCTLSNPVILGRSDMILRYPTSYYIMQIMNTYSVLL